MWFFCYSEDKFRLPILSCIKFCLLISSLRGFVILVTYVLVMLKCSFFYLPGLGFVTSITFIFLVGVFMSSWLGASVLSLGEWFIKRMPFVRHIYNASKQISSAISPSNLSSSLFCFSFTFFSPSSLSWAYY